MQHKPLTGIRILEVGGYISLPYATSMLCALGADVVKVEKPGAGDDFRRGDNDRSLYFVQYNTGKRSVSVDLKTPEGVALVKALIPRFDVLLENPRPGKLAGGPPTTPSVSRSAGCTPCQATPDRPSCPGASSATW